MAKCVSERRLRRDGDKERAWRERIADQRRGGGTVRAFCRERGLNENSFYHWRREIRLRDREAAGDAATPAATPGPATSHDMPGRRPATMADDASGRAPALARVVVIDDPRGGACDDASERATSSSPSAAAVEIVLGDGTTVRVPPDSTREQLGMVLAVLEPGRC